MFSKHLTLSQKGISVLAIILVVQLAFMVRLAVMQKSARRQIDEGLKIQAVIVHMNEVSNLWAELATNTFRFVIHKLNATQASTALLQYKKQFREEFRSIDFLLDNPDEESEIAKIERDTNAAIDLLLARANVGSESQLHHSEIGLLSDQCTERSDKFIDRFLARQVKNQLEQARSQTSLKLELALGLGLNFLLVVAVANLFVSEIADKLAQITDNSNRLAEGMTLNPVLIGGDEISVLDQKFHEMADALVAASIKERAVVDNALELICSLDRSAAFLSVNPAAQSILGYKPFELTGKCYLDFVASEDRERTKTALESAISGENIAPVEHAIMQKNGTRVFVQLSAYWSEIDESVFCVVYDITQRRHIELMKREFTKIITKDLREPLLKTESKLNSLASEVRDDDSAMASIDDITQEIEPLLQLISDLLELEKIDAANLTLELEPTAISEALCKALESLETEAAEKNIRFEGPPVDCVVSADKARFQQVVTALLSNAIKRSPTNGTVGVNCQQNEFVRLEISDQGADLSVDERELIFEPFRQTQQFTNGQVERPSLGLAICKSIVEAHQGAIGVTNDGAGNCTFWIQIPTAAIPIS